MVDRKALGTSGLMVSPIAFGGNVFGWTLNEKESFKLLDAFVETGANFIDTADSYSRWVAGNSGGESETIIGKWMKERGNRKDMIIATKLGSDLGDDKKGLSARYMKQAVEASLKRLQTDYIDLYQSHFDDLPTTVSETITAFNETITQGKVRFIGASNLSAERIAESNLFARENNFAPYISIQPLYNLFDREGFERKYLPLVERESLAVINYYSLASGFLTGKYRSEADLNKSPRGGGVKKYLTERGFKILAALDVVAEELNVEVAQVAVAWLLHKPFVTAPIASATSTQQLASLVAASTLHLTPGQMAILDTASAY